MPVVKVIGSWRAFIQVLLRRLFNMPEPVTVGCAVRRNAAQIKSEQPISSQWLIVDRRCSAASNLLDLPVINMVPGNSL